MQNTDGDRKSDVRDHLVSFLTAFIEADEATQLVEALAAAVNVDGALSVLTRVLSENAAALIAAPANRARRSLTFGAFAIMAEDYGADELGVLLVRLIDVGGQIGGDAEVAATPQWLHGFGLIVSDLAWPPEVLSPQFLPRDDAHERIAVYAVCPGRLNEEGRADLIRMWEALRGPGWQWVEWQGSVVFLERPIPPAPKDDAAGDAGSPHTPGA